MQSAQVALQAENFAVVILAAELSETAPYSLSDYLRVTRPETMVISLQDPGAPPPAEKTVDWVLQRPLSALELIQVIEYLSEDVDVQKRPRRGAFSYSGTARPASGGRNWVN